MAREAVTSALTDAGLQYQDMQAVVASYCYGDPACGQRAVYGEIADHFQSCLPDRHFVLTPPP